VRDESAFRASLDRIEEGLAVLLLREDESVRFTLPRPLLPEMHARGISWR
jgi:hypothetical protein